jgi:hypothetical protein
VAQTLTFGESGFTITDDSRPGTNKLEVVQSGNTLQGANSDNTTIVGLQVVGTADANRLQLNSADEFVTANRLEATFFAGDDVLTILGNTRQSNINLGSGNDTFTTDSQFREGTSLNMGTGNDIARFNATASRFADSGGNVLLESTVGMGEGDDLLVFGGSTRGSTINLGSGADTVRFRANAVDTSLNLGGDTDRDQVYLAASGNYETLRITGADSSDVLFIGSSEYRYRAARNDWQNIDDRNDVRTFNG